MATKSPKAAASKHDAVVVVPPAPLKAEDFVDMPLVDTTEKLAAVLEQSFDRALPKVVANKLHAALERIASGRLCGCKGDHDELQYECPKSIARAVLEAAK